MTLNFPKNLKYPSEDSINASYENDNVCHLAIRLCRSTNDVPEHQRSRILEALPKTVFISHTSLDDLLILERENEHGVPKKDSLYSIFFDRFYDPFYHSFKTGGAEAYERIVGLSLLASTRLFVIWSENASISNYVRAELLIAHLCKKKIAAFVMPNAPAFPLEDVSMVYNKEELKLFLKKW